ncbi:hypothetical protein RhiirA4_485449 [Rhizophagus irregularis]|uniref:Uncharacterized protein n=1 Tax=Rhizophagus irregularis TaxID=588596 RepID=A0A2I1HQ74_9GLOM|nr:hypothetical protein RhiirA4_485449 [Rhizophagus irregularis]
MSQQNASDNVIKSSKVEIIFETTDQDMGKNRAEDEIYRSYSKIMAPFDQEGWKRIKQLL